MAKKSKRMALYEAIQRGQAKIEEGLKTGHLRSDASSVRADRPETQKMYISARRSGGKDPDKFQDFLGRFSISRKVLLIGSVVLLQLAVFAVAFWLGALFFKDSKPALTPGRQIVSGREVDETGKTESSGGNSLFQVDNEDEDSVAKETDDNQDTEAPRLGGGSTGNNVIVIQSISWQRKEELRSIQDFFAKKGIQTDIVRDSKSDYALLVTLKGFKEKPENKGSDGYQLLQQIRQYGTQYPEETGDSKWGFEPFQDSYGLKRD